MEKIIEVLKKIKANKYINYDIQDDKILIYDGFIVGGFITTINSMIIIADMEMLTFDIFANIDDFELNIKDFLISLSGGNTENTENWN